ncbi:MAG: mechanosensitive ion channel family protein [Nitrospiraceae bacterium]|nr:MAG: mechanosensitive ion channel family protein [Nitrospiraceae bacterium]
MFEDFLQKTFLQNRVLDYIIFISTFIFGLLFIKILRNIVLHRLKAWADKTATTIDDFLISSFEKKLIPLLYFGVLYLSTKSLNLSTEVSKVINILGIVLLTLIGVRFSVLLLLYILETHWLKKETDETKKRSVKGIVPVIKVIIWGTGIAFLLDNLGFEISTVIAGLGIGGIAVALAAQAVLGDLFSYFSILLDRPFELGDFIVVGEYFGTIEHIGIKTTRVRSLGGEQLVFSNTDLTSSRLRNYKRMEQRRVVFSFGVTYQTTLEQLKEIPNIVKEIISSTPDTLFDRAHFKSYGDFSLDFEVVYYVLSRDYNVYMDTQQNINFRLKEEFEKRGIEFAYPTQTLFVERTSES